MEKTKIIIGLIVCASVALVLILLPIQMVSGMVCLLYPCGNHEKEMPRAYGLHSTNCSRICVTKDCLITANEMVHAMDASVDPCSDFYQYACGNFIRQRYPSNGQVSSIFTDAASDMYHVILRVISNISELSPNVYQKLKIFYSNCADFTSTEILYVRGIKNMIFKTGLENWPRREKERIIKTDVRDKVYSQFLAMGEYALIKIAFEKYFYPSNDTNDEFVDISISMGPLILQWSNYVSHNLDHSDEYKDIIETVLDFFGFDGDVEQTTSEIIQLESNLAYIHDKFENDFEMDEDNADEHAFFILNSKWAAFFREYFSTLDENIDLSRVRVIYTNPQALEELKDFVDMTPHDIISNYLAVRLIIKNLRYSNFLMRTFFSGSEILEEELKRPTSQRDFCMKVLLDKLPMLVTSAYSQKYLTPGTLERLQKIYQGMKNNTIDYIENTRMYDDTLKDYLKKKISKVFSPVDQITRSCDLTFLTTLYNHFKIEAREFVVNIIEDRLFAANMRVIIPFRKVNFELCHNVVPEVDAEAFTDRIFIGLGMLRPPLFSVHRPAIIDVAKLGFVVAHEMGHTIELLLKPYNKTQMTERNLDANSQCYVDQYSEFKWHFINETFKATETLNENVADNFGQHIAFLIFEMFMEENGEELRFMGLGPAVSAHHAYFLAIAQSWCEILTPDGEMGYHEYDPHSPGELRILGTLRNSEAFAKYFQCPLGSPMNPSQKCQV